MSSLLGRTALAIVASALVIVPQSLPAAEGLASVKGTVTVDGRPVAEGKVVLHAVGEKAIEIPIKNGSYAADKVPPGKKTVAILGRGVPAKYSSRETTPLAAEIVAGANELDFALRS